MKFALLTYSLITLLFFLTNCSKPNADDPVPPLPIAPTKAQLLLGKWNVVSIVHAEVNGPARFTYTGNPSDYFNFAKDTLYGYVQGNYQNPRYVLHANDSISLYYPPLSPVLEEHLLVTNLTATSLQIRGKTQSGDIGIVSLKK